MVFLEVLLFHTVLQGFVRFATQLALAAFTFACSAPGTAPARHEAAVREGAVLKATPLETAVPETTAQDTAAQEAGFQEASAPASQPAPKPFLFEPTEGAPGVLIPRQEKLVYSAYLDLSIASANVGTVTQTCSVQEQQVPLMVAQPAASAGDLASIKLDADGGYLWYSLKSTLETQIFPKEKEWPRLYYQQRSESKSTTRRREVKIGRKEGVPSSSYRGDTSNGAPPGTRIWRNEELRAVPAGTLDMLTAVFMARALIGQKKESLTFPLLDKTRIWNLSLRRGEERRMETGKAGTFDVVEVVLVPEPYPGEPVSEKAKQFEGVFGIHGSIHLWVDRKTGIAVRIQGELPIDDGLITLGIDVKLDSYSGTPPEFAPVPEKKR